MSGDRQTEVAGDTIVDSKVIKKDGTFMDVRWRVGKIETSRRNPTAPGFNPRDDRPVAGQNTGSDRDCSDNAQNLNN